MNPMRLGVLLRLAVILALGLVAPPTVSLAQGSLLTWSTVPSPNQNTLNNHLYGVSTVASTDVWAVGEYNSGVPPTVTGRRTLTEHWDGQAWSIVPSPSSTVPSIFASHLRGVDALATDDVWSVGYGEASAFSQTLILHWNGSVWSIVPGPPFSGANQMNQLYAVSGVATNDVWAVGERDVNMDPLTIHWNGSAWVNVPNGCAAFKALDGVVAISAADVWAVGNKTTCHWNGTSWTAVKIPLPNGRGDSFDVLTAVSATSSSDVWAVGRREIDGPIPQQFPFVEHWDGKSWTLTTNIPGGYLAGVVALAPDNVYAVGQDTTFFGLVDHWDGSAWTKVPSPRTGSSAILQSVAAVSSLDLWTVGAFFSSPTSPDERTLIEHGS